MKRGLRGALLAAGSVMAVAMAMGGRAEAVPVSCSVTTNPGLPYTQSGNTCVTFTATPTGSGAVTNNGTVNANGASNPTATGISVLNGAAINGSIVNNGAITGANYGVLVNQGSVSGSITNATGATITANTKPNSEAIYIQNAQVGAVTNAGTLNGGIFLTGAAATATTIGAVTNTGTINAGIGAGNFGADINVSEVTVNGDVSNTGKLVDNSTGAIQIINTGVVNGSVTNSGTITNTFDQGAGIFVFANSHPDGVDPAPFAGQLITGSVSNLAGGTIGAAYGIQVFATSAAAPVEIQGDVSNAGTITASQTGIVIGSATVDGAITNGGSITATSGNGIQVINLSTTPGGTTLGTAGAPNIKGGITNSGTITAGQNGIDVANASVGGIANAKSATITASNGAGIRVAKTGQVIYSGGTEFTTGSAGSTITGDIANAGTITAKTGIAVVQGSTVTGNINNTGSLTGSLYGVFVEDSTVTGSITNATGATITANTNANGEAIYIQNASVGAITNNGTLNGGIFVTGAAATATSTGAITNTGTINAGIGAGNFGADISVSETTVNGDVSNTGKLVDNSTGAIQIINTGVVNGSVTNSGTITNTFDQGAGIWVYANPTGPFAGQTITGSVANLAGGAITGAYGIEVFATNSAAPVNVQGSVYNNGAITASQSGIVIGSAQVTGSVSNSGAITATNGNGIEVTNLPGTAGASNVGAIGNSGTITAGQNGIDLANANVGSIINAANGSITANNGVGIRIAETGVVIYSGGTSVSTGSAGSTVTGEVANAGSITAKTGIAVIQGSTVTGEIDNYGTITGSTYGVLVNGGTVGDILNDTNGTITANSGALSEAIYVQDATVGPITNKGTLNGGIFLTGAAATGTSVGAITNNGTINAGIGAGNFGADINVSEVTVNGNISNTGKLVDNSTGAIQIINTGVVNGSVLNSGTITNNFAQGAGIYVYANPTGPFAGQTITGSISNLAGGTITGAYGIEVFATDSAAPVQINGSVSNAGTITASQSGIVLGSAQVADAVSNSGVITATHGDGIELTNLPGTAGATNVNAISNSGTITAGQNGIDLANANVASITNTKSGTITASNGVGIRIAKTGVVIYSGGTSVGTGSAGSTVSGDVTNAGTITAKTGIAVAQGSRVDGSIVNTGTITGATAAIDVSGAGAASTIDQEAGTITGAILLSANADTVNITGGTINGDIVGGGGANQVNFALGSGSFDYKYAFTNVGFAVFEGGTVTLEGADTPDHVTISAGEVIIGNNDAFGTAAPYVYTNTTLGFLSNANYNVSNNFTLNGTVSISAPGGTVQTLSGVISDSAAPGEPGAVNVIGSGVLNLTGANTYSGGTSLDAGTLRVGVDTVGTVGAITSSAIGRGTLAFDGGTLQAGGDFTIDNAATVGSGDNGAIDANGYAFTYAGAIAGAGGLTIANSGSGGGVIFTANNTYTGGTTITGELQLGNGGASGSVAGDIVDNGTLIFDRSDTSTYGGAISGSGGVVQAGSGVTILTGSSTYAGGTTISAGTLQIGNGGTAGSISGDVADDGVLAFDRSDDTSFAGAITGTGELLQKGSGTLTLTGTSSVGSTVVQDGTLIVNGPLTSTYTIDTGATLQGSTSTLLTANTITDNGTLVFDQGSDGVIGAANAIEGAGELVKDGAGLLTLDGTASVGSTIINSGNLRIGDSGSPTALLTSPSVMVNPNGTLSGHGTIVGSVTNNGTVAPGGTIGVLTINGNYTQTSTGVLQIEINPTTSSELVVTGTANLAGTVNLVADPGDYRKGVTYTFLSAGTIVGSFSSITNNAGLDIGPGALTGQAVVLAGVFTPQGSTGNQTAIGQALVNVPAGVNTDFDTIATAVLALSGAAQNSALDELGGEVDADLPNMARDSARTFMTGISEQLRTNGPDSDAAISGDPWGRAYGNFGSANGNLNAHGYDDTSGGVMLGASHAVGPNALVGAAFDYEHTDLTLQGLPQTGSLNIWAGALYGEVRSGPFFFDAAGSLGYDSNSSTRHIDFSSISRLADGSFGGFTGSAMGTVGQRVPFGVGMVFEPSASIVYTHVHQDGFTENSGSGADLGVDSLSQDAVESVLQGKVTKTMALASGAVLRASLNGGWAHEFESTATDVTETFAVAGATPFTLAGAGTSRNYGLFGASLTYDLSKQLSFFGRYDGAYGDREVNHAVSVGFSMKW